MADHMRADPPDPATLNAGSVEVGMAVLGRGAWCVVRAGSLLSGGRHREVAVKSFHPNLKTAEEERELLRQEIKIAALATAHCERICSLLGTVEKEGQLCLVMPRFAKSLSAVLHAAPGRRLIEPRALELATQVARALIELHALFILFLDLKPSNLLLTADERTLVVADFGAALRLGTDSTIATPPSVRATTRYMAPEAFNPEMCGVGMAADVWSAGCCMLEMLSGMPPWHGERREVVRHKLCEIKLTPQIPVDVPAPTLALLDACFRFSPVSRPTAADLTSRLESRLASLAAANHATCKSTASNPAVSTPCNAASQPVLHAAMSAMTTHAVAPRPPQMVAVHRVGSAPPAHRRRTVLQLRATQRRKPPVLPLAAEHQRQAVALRQLVAARASACDAARACLTPSSCTRGSTRGSDSPDVLLRPSSATTARQRGSCSAPSPTYKELHLPPTAASLLILSAPKVTRPASAQPRQPTLSRSASKLNGGLNDIIDSMAASMAGTDSRSATAGHGAAGRNVGTGARRWPCMGRARGEQYLRKQNVH